AHERVHYLGMLPHTDTAKLFSALDVGVIYLRDTPFGRYCFPQKAYEMQACELPVIATAVGVMPHLLSSAPQALYPEKNVPALVKALDFQIKEKKQMNITVENWKLTIAGVEREMCRIASGCDKS
ncbi:MAG: glycosyltransferase family 4 protein, partial [Clostridiales bacterium]|nr:glycosyltransferase family 4 protein [Clostridiales bacterium]